MDRQVRNDLLLLLALALVVRVLTAWPLQRPGYMDPCYYVDGALSLYNGLGFNDPFLWNYLDDPAGIPHPSHLYWMPLSSLVIWPFFKLFGVTYRSAQIPFILLSSLWPTLAYLAARDVADNRRHAWLAATFALFSGFYMPYWVTTDNFAPFALLGGLSLWAVGRGLRDDRPTWFAVAGVAAGLAHLTRADGWLLLPGIGIAALWQRTFAAPHRRPFSAWIRPVALRYTLLILCYLLVLAPWFARNVAAVGAPLPTAGGKTAWLTDYDDLYSYGKPLTLSSYLAWGWDNIIRSKLKGLWLNLQTTLFVGWMIFLAPFGVIGVWRLRHRTDFMAAWWYGLLLYLTMSLVFTFPGWRGGMFHSLSALLPFLYAASVEGLDAFVYWMARRRRTWRVRQAQMVFGVAFVIMAATLSGAIYLRGLPRFRGEHIYRQVGKWMDEHVSRPARVMVNDPPSFYYHARRECVVIPNAGLDVALAVMERYGVEYLALDQNNPSLRSLYDSPDDDERLQLVASFDGPLYLFRRSATRQVWPGTRTPVVKGPCALNPGSERPPARFAMVMYDDAFINYRAQSPAFGSVGGFADRCAVRWGRGTLR